MLVQKTFRHPLHLVNYYRAIMKQALKQYNPAASVKTSIPVLDQSLEYYFLYETAVKEAENLLMYGITCFDADGVIIFSHKGTYPVSLWRIRRQGIARTAKMFEGVIKTAFRNKCVPLMSNEPFRQVDQGLYVCNISWSVYNKYLE